MPSVGDDDPGLAGSLSVLLAFGESVTFTATISNLAGLDGVFVASGDVDEAQNNLHQLGLAVIQYDGGPSPLKSDYSGAAPGEDVMCQNNLKIGDDFIIIDYKPTESLKADDNFLVIDWLAEDHFKVDPSDPSVDPTNPNVDLRPMETPGPDDNVGLPAVQTDDGLLLPAVKTGAWIADVTYERAARPECTNNLKQIALGVHALDAGECNDICAQNSPPASPEPGTYTGGRFALEIDGHSSSPANNGAQFYSRTDVNGLYGSHGSSILEFSVENFPAFPQPENNAVATESLEIAHEGFLGDHDDGWCMATEIDSPESVHALYDLIV